MFGTHLQINYVSFCNIIQNNYVSYLVLICLCLVLIYRNNKVSFLKLIYGTICTVFDSHLQISYVSCLILINTTFMYHVWYSFTFSTYLRFMFETHLQNNYVSCLVLIYRIIIYHVCYSFTEQLCIKFGMP